MYTANKEPRLATVSLRQFSIPPDRKAAELENNSALPNYFRDVSDPQMLNFTGSSLTRRNTGKDGQWLSARSLAQHGFNPGSHLTNAIQRPRTIKRALRLLRELAIPEGRGKGSEVTDFIQLRGE